MENHNKRKSIMVEEGDSTQKITRYSCSFCEKTYKTGQALGGHQRGHKHERNVIHGMKPRSIPRHPRGKLSFITGACKVDMENINGWKIPDKDEVKEADHDQNDAKSEFKFVLLPMKNARINGSGSQQIPRTEIDFFSGFKEEC
ncbi:probable transcriptional regulator RABBIT EARS [Vicia villosa]|uniref:probable transcriptional regulator RABBIT EARS n=1 Tax=Vicia villosa TaxID=3911 RepID=UPI00273B3427|nr:probable transcriptional regulator RABBIT EARS [Vicia villosa]